MPDSRLRLVKIRYRVRLASAVYAPSDTELGQLVKLAEMNARDLKRQVELNARMSRELLRLKHLKQ